jgi:hypothetical protein
LVRSQIALLEKMSDRDLVKLIKSTMNREEEREARHVLYRRYERFVHKHWHSLSSRMNRSAAVMELKNDFYAESYIVFEKALKATNVTKIRDDKWKFLGYYGFYLSTLKNNFAKGIVNQYHNEVSIEINAPSTDRSIILSDLSEAGVVQSAEDEVIERDQRRRFWSALTQCQSTIWDETKRTIWNRRASGVSIRDTCEELGISTWRFNKILSEMKTQLDSAIVRA